MIYDDKKKSVPFEKFEHGFLLLRFVRSKEIRI